MKIVLAGDNHGDYLSIQKILNDNPDGEYYFHTGDSELDESVIEPFISVCGNNDYFFDYPDYRILEIPNHRILLIHGSRMITPEMEMLESLAKENDCDAVFYGHTHVFADRYINGIHFINPGSTYYNRDHSKPCYALICDDGEGGLKAKRIDL